MIARKRPRPQPDDDSDDKHRKCLRIVTFDSTLDSEIMETKSFVAKLHKVSSLDGDYLIVYRANGHFRVFNYLMEVLHIFDRQDLFHLYDLVMKQYSEITPEDMGRSRFVVHAKKEREEKEVSTDDALGTDKEKDSYRQEKDSTDRPDEGIPEAEKKFKQLARDEEMAKKVQEDWEAKEEVKKLTEEEAIKAALSNEYDFIQARNED
ncbi:hypothetical protein Tco_0821754 [Tanacetum coccineum]|uniref:Uncharacterized protein n=1 Tax=Tanacetum coccineum TaxID=301880 RepID=A0ABQ5AD70_9ASTR